MNEFKRGMMAKTIKKIIKGKITDWLKNVENEEIKSIIKNNIIVTGGAIASMLLGEEVKDFDVYLSNREAALKVAKYYVDEFNTLNPDYVNKLGIQVKAYVLDYRDKTQVDLDRVECGSAGHLLNMDPDRIKIVIRSDGVASEKKETLNAPFSDVYEVLDAAEEGEIPETEGKHYRPIFLSSNAITLANKVQVVIRFFGDADKIHENYDFTHCTNYYDSGTDTLVLRPEAMQALLSRELVYQGSKYPICSMIRTRKFIKRGWHINAGQYLKMAFQVSKLDLADLAVLEDQLVGVDSAYFMQLIHALQTKKSQDPTFTVNNEYLATVIDKLF